MEKAKKLWLGCKRFWRSVSKLVPFRWSSLKSAVNSRFARLTVIVPIIGWVLIYNDNLVRYLEEVFQQEFSSEFNWRVYIFYVGLFLISVSSILYSVFCPKEINDHSDVVDYAKHFRLVFTEKFEQELSQENGLEPMNWGDPADSYRRQGAGTFSLADKQSENDEEMIDRLQADYLVKNASWPLIRLTALASFVAGAILASLPTIATVHWAACSTVKDTVNTFLIDKFEDSCATYFDGGENHLKYVE